MKNENNIKIKDSKKTIFNEKGEQLMQNKINYEGLNELDMAERWYDEECFYPNNIPKDLAEKYKDNIKVYNDCKCINKLICFEKIDPKTVASSMEACDRNCFRYMTEEEFFKIND